MSSSPFGMGIRVVDDFKYDPPFEGAEISFVMRGKDEQDVMRKIAKIPDDVPEEMEVLFYHIGMRPDRPIPVAKYFVVVQIHDKKKGRFSLFWHGGWRGRKKKS